MPDPANRLVVLVHGYSVTSTEAYGHLAARLVAEAEAQAGLALDIHNIWLSRYVSFRDEVRIDDLARGLQAAVQRELGAALAEGRRFVCVTHSTGGPVVREWWNRFYPPGGRQGPCPMSHLIMLAPANFGSALAQLGKGTLGRLKAWFDRVEPGQGVLDWLELGSREAWDLNRGWMDYPDPGKAAGAVLPFVLTGQTIDRKLYDHINSYTGENGSDGVVRVAAANLNCNYLELVQRPPTKAAIGRADDEGTLADLSTELKAGKTLRAPRTAFALVKGRSHSGADIGIVRSIEDNRAHHPTVDAVLKCILVDGPAAYRALCDEFDESNAKVEAEERLEWQDKKFRRDSYVIHDPFSMVIFRLRDDAGHVVRDFDLKLTGEDGDPDGLPPGFFGDRQLNRRDPGALTYFVNHAVMVGTDALVRKGNRVIRPRLMGARELGMEITPRPGEGYVHYLKAVLRSKTANIARFLKPHETLMVDVVLRRLVREGVYQLTTDPTWTEFKEQDRGGLIS